MKLTAAICTYKNREIILDTIYSLLFQDTAHHVYEILIVNNFGDDDGYYSDLVTRFNDEGFKIRTVTEEVVGLSRAKNRAAVESKGDYVLFIDDDAIVTYNYISSYISAINDKSPDVLGGDIHPHFEEAPKEEYGYRFWMHWSVKFFGNQDRYLNEGEHFLGGNIAIKRSLLLEYKHDESKGRTGQVLLGAEERLWGDSKFSRLFVKKAHIYHKVSNVRQTRKYMSKRMLGNYLTANKVPSCFRIVKSVLFNTLLDLREFKVKLIARIMIMKGVRDLYHKN
jgi:glucosyl-dolichyl phosphate glucuronosyltransferase